MALFLSLVQTWPGGLVTAGVLIALLVFTAPIFMEAPTSTQAADKLIFITNHGLSLASTLIGLGLLCLQLEYPQLFAGTGRYRLVIPGFFFAFAGFKYFGGARHWTRLRP